LLLFFSSIRLLEQHAKVLREDRLNVKNRTFELCIDSRNDD